MQAHSDTVEAVAWAEAQRVLTYLRANRKYGDLSRGCRELPEASPVRRLCSWRCSEPPQADLGDLLEGLLDMVRSPEVAGPLTFVAVEAVNNIIMAMFDHPSWHHQRLNPVLEQVCAAACECAFEETSAQVDEAVTVQIVQLLKLCTTRAMQLPESGQESGGTDGATTSLAMATRLRAFDRVLALWTYYRNSPSVRLSGHTALQGMLDGSSPSSVESHSEFLRSVLEQMLDDVMKEPLHDRAMLYLRLMQRITTHPMAFASSSSSTTSCGGATDRVRPLEDAVPLLLMCIADRFGLRVSALSLLLPVVNWICTLCLQSHTSQQQTEETGLAAPNSSRLCTSNAGFGALQVEALVSIYIRILSRVTDSLQQDGSPTSTTTTVLTLEEVMEVLTTLMEGLCDLLQPSVCQMLWCSFDAVWHRPPLLERLVVAVAGLFSRDTPNTEQPFLPAYVSHLGATVLAKVVAAFDSSGSTPGGRRPCLTRLDELEATLQEDDDRISGVRDQLKLREDLMALMKQISDKPKKARAIFEASSVYKAIHLTSGRLTEFFEEWAAKLALLLRTANYAVPYPAVGEFFGQPAEESAVAFMAFAETFDWGSSDIEGALRVLLQSFLLPKEAQQIDRLLKTFAHTYYRKHIESSAGQQHYLRHEDAAYTLAFSVIMLNTDQHNPRLKRRMKVEDFLRNNEGINEGEDIPQDVQRKIFASINKDEIKTPNSGDLVEGASKARWQDFLHLINQGHRDNSLLLQQKQPTFGMVAHAWGLVERVGTPLRVALETALANDAGTNSDALQGLEHLMRVAHNAGRSADADGVLECLFLFGIEVFFAPQPKTNGASRAARCLNTLFQTVLASGRSPSTRQLHALAYLSVQFALYGLFDGTVLPPPDAVTADLLCMPAFVVDPPAGAVYNFLRKISTAPFGMFALREDTDSCASQPPPMPPREKSTPASALGLVPEGDGAEPLLPAVPHAESAAAVVNGSQAQNQGLSGPAASPRGYPAASPRSYDPLRRQVESAFEAGQLAAFIRSLVEVPEAAGQESEGGDAQMSVPAQPVDVLGFLSALFITLRTGSSAKVAKEEDQPQLQADDQKVSQASTVPASLILPKRALSLNIQDGYDTLHLATRLSLLALGCSRAGDGGLEADGDGGESGGAPPGKRRWSRSALLDFATCAHIGTFHTLRRPDLTERTLRVSLIALFRVGSLVLSASHRDDEDEFAVPLGWPIRLLNLATRRSEAEPQLLIPFASLCLTATRAFVIEVSCCRKMTSLELWRALLNFLSRAMPTCNRALWPGARDKEMQAIQQDLWMKGIMWLLGHPHLFESIAQQEASVDAAASASTPRPSFLTDTLNDLANLAHEMAGGNRQEASKLLLMGYHALLIHILADHDARQHAQCDPSVSLQMEQHVATTTAGDTAEPLAIKEPMLGAAGNGIDVEGGQESKSQTDQRIIAARAAAWGRVATSLLGRMGPLLSRPQGGADTDLPLMPLLLQALLDVRISAMLDAAPSGPNWARQALEQLVTVWTKAVSAGAPLSTVRAAVPLVAKFFLQNLQTLQRHECFSQLWLMVLRLMLLFIERGIHEHCLDLQEIATETLKNLLRVLLSSQLLQFVAPRGNGPTTQPDPQEETAAGGIPVWWQMTWDCIEVFLPGFGEEFSRRMPPKGTDTDGEPNGESVVQEQASVQVPPSAGSEQELQPPSSTSEEAEKLA